MTAALRLVSPINEMIARCNACANGYRMIGRDFSASTVTGFARDIEAGMPWKFYVHWLAEAEARLERFKERPADIADWLGEGE